MLKVLGFLGSATNTQVLKNNTKHECDVKISVNAKKFECHLIQNETKKLDVKREEIGEITAIATILFSNHQIVEFSFRVDPNDCVDNVEINDEYVIYNGTKRGNLVKSSTTENLKKMEIERIEELKRLNATIQNLTNDKQQLSDSVENYKKIITQQNDENISKLSEKEKIINTNNSTIKKLESDIKSLENKYNDKMKENIKLINDKQQLNNDKQQLNNDKQQLSDSIANYKKINADIELKYNTIAQQNNENILKLGEKEKIINTNNSAIKKLESDIKILENKYSEQMIKCSDTMKENIKITNDYKLIESQQITNNDLIRNLQEKVKQHETNIYNNDLKYSKLLIEHNEQSNIISKNEIIVQLNADLIKKYEFEKTTFEEKINNLNTSWQLKINNLNEQISKLNDQISQNNILYNKLKTEKLTIDNKFNNFLNDFNSLGLKYK